MSATQENSVLCSLNQLMDDYEARVHEEQEAALREAEAERKARDEALRVAEEQAARRAREDAERKAREDAAKQEEAARLEAIRLAAIERARIEAETQARIEMQKRAEEHARMLETLREDEKKKRLQRAIWTGALCGAAAILGSAGLYFGKVKPDNEARLVQQAAEINARFEEKRRIEAEVEANRKRIEQAESALLRAKQLDTLEAPQATPKEPPGQRPADGARNSTKTSPKTSECLPGEPGCDLNGKRIF